MRERPVTIMDTLLEQLIETGPDGMARVFTALFELAMRTERDQHIGAGRYERTDDRQGYANGYKPKKVDTPAGTLTVQVPKTREHEEPFYPQSLERGRRGSRAVMLAIAQMYVQGVSTRDPAKVMKEFGLDSLSSTEVSRAARKAGPRRRHLATLPVPSGPERHPSRPHPGHSQAHRRGAARRLERPRPQGRRGRTGGSASASWALLCDPGRSPQSQPTCPESWGQLTYPRPNTRSASPSTPSTVAASPSAVAASEAAVHASARA